MCPDKQLISVYMDGELPSPWLEKMESHLASCPDCRQRLEQYRAVSMALRMKDEKAEYNEAQAKERVWLKLQGASQDQAGNEASVALQNIPKRTFVRKSLWRRTVQVPVSALAAAAAVLVAFFSFSLNTQAGMVKPSAAALDATALAAPLRSDAVAVADVPVSVSISGNEALPSFSMNDIQQYIASDASEVVQIELPDVNLSSTVKPVVVRAADYTRSSARP